VTPVDTAYSDVPARGGGSTSDDDLLVEIRDRYKAYDVAWKDIRTERNTDVKYISGDPWEARDRKAREDVGRPCINHDELAQYINQTVNTMRQNKRGIKVDPRGEGSTDQTATLRQDLIRTIEYDSDAPSIYAKAYQDMVEGSYAFFRITHRYVSDQYSEFEEDDPQSAVQKQGHNRSLFDQHIVIRPIANNNSVLFYPYCKEPDWSDAEDCFLLDRIPRKRFKQRWPKAQVTDFSYDQRMLAPDWFSEDNVLVAEYWRVEYSERTVYLLANGEVLDSPKGNYTDERQLREKKVVQRITNGLEILEEKQEMGTILPIIPMIGLERYLDDKRVLFSLVRLARDPQMSLAYLNSQQTEEAGLTPKTPFLGYKGQFDSNRTMWTNVTKIPYGFLEADIPDNWPAGQVPPLPTRVPFTPNFGAYEVAKDSCRRAIQAAMGIMPMPTAAQRQNDKSGVALQKIQDEEALGSYHFVDGYDRALRLAGRVIDQWIPAVYSREGRQVHLRTAKDEYRQATLNTAQPYQDTKSGKPAHYPVDEVDHSISVSTGPSYQSQRDAVNDFLDNLIGQLPKLPIAPQQAAQILSIAVKMKDLGPMGDELAEIISPTGQDGQQSAQQLQQAQGQLQQQGIMIQQLQAELQKLTVEKQAKVVEGEYKMMTERLRANSALVVEKLKVDAQMASAEISTKSQILSERMAAVDELYRMAHEQLDDASAKASDQAHERALSHQEHQQDLAQADQAHQQTLQQQDQASQAAAQQQQQAAQQQPPEPGT
jgi:Phage P22-like portal protein